MRQVTSRHGINAVTSRMRQLTSQSHLQPDACELALAGSDRLHAEIKHKKPPCQYTGSRNVVSCN
eukprot:3937620-Rhodomonas_salina.4